MAAPVLWISQPLPSQPSMKMEEPIFLSKRIFPWAVSSISLRRNISFTSTSKPSVASAISLSVRSAEKTFVSEGIVRSFNLMISTLIPPSPWIGFKSNPSNSRIKSFSTVSCICPVVVAPHTSVCGSCTGISKSGERVGFGNSARRGGKKKVSPVGIGITKFSGRSVRRWMSKYGRPSESL